MTLYDLKGEFLRLYELATQEEDRQAFLDTLEALKGELEVKAAGYVHVMKQIEMEEKECDAVIEAFKAKKELRKNSRKRMAEALLDAMDIAGISEIKAGEYNAKIAKNGGLQPLKIDGDVPDEFMKVIYEADKDLIRKTLAEGNKLDFARLEERGRHLNIK